MSTTAEKTGFEREGGSYLQPPTPKRVRYHPSDGAHAHPTQVAEVVETVETEEASEVDTLTITVPSSDFEVEIGSQVVEVDDADQIPQISRRDLTGPAFDIVQDAQVRIMSKMFVLR